MFSTENIIKPSVTFWTLNFKLELKFMLNHQKPDRIQGLCVFCSHTPYQDVVFCLEINVFVALMKSVLLSFLQRDDRFEVLQLFVHRALKRLTAKSVLCYFVRFLFFHRPHFPNLIKITGFTIFIGLITVISQQLLVIGWEIILCYESDCA